MKLETLWNKYCYTYKLLMADAEEEKYLGKPKRI
jgi:hypothetical protein